MQRDRQTVEAEAEHRFQLKKDELEKQRGQWFLELEQSRREFQKDFEKERRQLAEKNLALERELNTRRQALKTTVARQN